MKGEDIAERLIDFAVRIIRLGAALPKNQVGKHVAGQIVRSGTSVGANYEEARAAESRADFTHKLTIALKELRESLFWLKVIDRAEMLPHKRMVEIIREADELCAILTTSVVTAKKKAPKKARKTPNSGIGSEE
ncbi:MAG: four helix bundle protein [Deltaproteobacteria bacterium]|nr:four helix bundle protein [Deltaproteobacteria bacterium]MBW2330703.1 four helix bundle protein [Deltaproteobacteria bacterium]